MEFKSLPQFTKEITERTVVGIMAVHGNVDDGMDRSWPGAFADTRINGRNRVRFLWQHARDMPPIASVNYIRDVPRADLPARVLEHAPDATGGAEISRSYLETPRADEVLAGIKAGAIDEMSYAYDPAQFDFEKLDDGRMVRNLRKVELYDASDVNWGMNPATAAVKALLETDMGFDQHSDAVETAAREYVKRVRYKQEIRAKEGRVLSDANRKRIEALVTALQAVSDDLSELLAATAPKADPAKVRALYIDYQRLQARLNGAIL